MTEDLESGAKLIEINASEILDKIQGEVVEYDHVIIKDNLDINDLNPKENENFIITSSIKITNSKIIGNVNFNKAIFKGSVNFTRTTFCEYAGFDRAIFYEYARFDGATFCEDADFNGTKFKGYANFSRATFNGYADFRGATFSRHAGFRVAKFGSFAYFDEATFCAVASFSGAIFNKFARFIGATFCVDVSFGGATFSGVADFIAAEFKGESLIFRNATFTLPKSQEEACRRAKNVLTKAGNRDEEEYHFYREMEAKRMQKGIRGNSELGFWYLLLKTETWSARRLFGYDVIEYIFVQKIFRYGTDPYWLFGCWVVFVVFFAFIYSIWGAIEEPAVRQWYDYFWFSVATAATPGYALYKPVGMFKFIAGIQAILGTFMWAAFITTFARKFSR